MDNVTTFARRFFVQLIVCAAFEVVTMGGFRRGIGTRAKTKLDVGMSQMQLDYDDDIMFIYWSVMTPLLVYWSE